MRIRRWIPAIVAGMVVISGGCIAVTAASSPAAALIVGAEMCNSVKIDNDVMCIVPNDPGAQVFTEPYPDGYGYAYTAGDQLEDVTTGLCLKDDPNVGNIVVELACTGSGSTALKETWIAVQYNATDSYYENLYAVDNGISSAYLHMDTSDGYVNCYKYGASGWLWYTPT